jgi:hypothetical protein
MRAQTTKKMKKVILSLGLFVLSISAFPCGTSWNACGADDVVAMIEDIMQNCGPGTTTIVDLCDNNHEYIVVMGFAGPNSSGG